MRQVTVTVRNIAAGFRDAGGLLVLTGEDEATGELVTFRFNATELVEFQKRCFARSDPASDLMVEVEDADVLRVLAGPVSGEWDSPGTSPEGDE